MKGFVNQIRIQADESGNLPTTIELLKTGSWHTPWHGDFDVTKDDIQQYIANFDAGVGLASGKPEAPINYAHAAHLEAAGWMYKLYASEDGEALLTDPEWIDDAVEAIKKKKWTRISPEFNPRSWPWEDPEEEHHFVNNVLTGAALTNIPLFKKLKPITASRLPSPGVKADAEKVNQEGDAMNLEEIRAKALADLTEEEKTFLAEHKAELTEEERTKFEIPADEAPEETETPAESEAPAPTEGGAPVEASALKGITEAELTQLRADAAAGRKAMDDLERSRATEFVKTHIAAGRIKSDQIDSTVTMILASKGDARTALESFIGSLPVNALLADERGTGADVDTAVEVTDAEKTLADDFGNTPEEIEAFKKQQADGK